MSEFTNGFGNGLESRQDALQPTNGVGTNGSKAPIKKPAKTKAGYILVDPDTGDFVKGGPGGPGYPKGRKRRDFFAELIRDLEAVELKKRKAFLRHRWERAFDDDGVASDMMSYLLPKPKPIEHTDPPELQFHAPASVTVIQNADITFNGSHA